MTLSIEIDAMRKVLLATYSGEFTLAEAQETFHQILDGLVEHKLRKVIVDGRQIEGDPEPLERFFYGKYVADAVTQVVNRGHLEVPRFAYVLKEPVLDPKRFGETVAVNRGMRLKTFEQIKQAEWWLGVSPRE